MGWERTFTGWVWNDVVDPVLQTTGDMGLAAISGGTDPNSRFQAPPPGAASATPDASIVTTQEQQASSILSTAGIPSGDSLMNQDQILTLFHARGVDISNPQVQQAAQTFASLYTDPHQQAQTLDSLAASYAAQFPKPLSGYQQLVQKYNLQDVKFGPTVTPPADYTNTGFSLDHGFAPEAPSTDTKVPHGKDVVFHNGVWYYRNGVIADPSQGGVAYPSKGAENIPGSPVWMANAAKSWDSQKTEAWRQELRRLGYPSIAKNGGWDYALQQATQKFYSQKYLNGGQVVPYNVKGAAGSGTGGSPPLDLHQLVGTIQADVQRQYQSVFGQDPTPDEMKSWTQFVINTGMKLQQGGQRDQLSPDAALNEAEARAARQITTSPEGSTYIQNAQENTTLHNGLVSAISAVRGLA
jgi:hypothetical protein